MNAPVSNLMTFEPRPLYGIGTVARLTGIKPDTLRVWERRYGLGASYKSPTGRRQYTQADLDHLQMIATLVQDGVRIGEIADSSGKTLEVLLGGRMGEGAKITPAKPVAVFVGRDLCHWLDEHQGCISSVSAFLARMDLDAAVERVNFDQAIDLLVVDCGSLSPSRLAGVESLAKRLSPVRTLICHRMANSRWLDELHSKGFRDMQFPPDPAKLAYEIGQCVVERETSRGEFDAGELVATKPRVFEKEALEAANQMTGLLGCECPRHLSALINDLNEFETYSTECSVENWRDASVHATIYAYTAQARWLMERALKAVIDQHPSEYQAAMLGIGADADGESE